MKGTTLLFFTLCPILHARRTSKRGAKVWVTGKLPPTSEKLLPNHAGYGWASFKGGMYTSQAADLGGDKQTINGETTPATESGGENMSHSSGSGATTPSNTSESSSPRHHVPPAASKRSKIDNEDDPDIKIEFADHAANSEAGRGGLAISATLVCGIFFVMGLFYLLNHRKENIRRFSYDTISAAIGIFVSILLFQAFDGVIQTYALNGHDARFKLIVNIAHTLCWFILLQVSLARFAGVIGGKPKSSKKMMLNLKCWSVLLANITGFAWQNSWSVLAHTDLIKKHPAMIFQIVPVAAVFAWILQRIADGIRETLVVRDNIDDELEHVWDAETKEAEKNVLAFTVSFLFVKAFGSYISGKVEMGIPSSHTYHTGRDAMLLVDLACAFVLVIVVGMHGKVKYGWRNRFFKVVFRSSCLGFAWSIFSASWWYLASLDRFGNNLLLLAVVQAAAMSTVAFLWILFLNFLFEQLGANEELDEEIVQVIYGTGILIGFAWEQCFYHASISVSHQACLHTEAFCDTSIQLMLCLACSAIMVPAWRFWILPMSMQEGWRFGFVPEERQVRMALAHLQNGKRRSIQWEHGTSEDTSEFNTKSDSEFSIHDFPRK